MKEAALQNCTYAFLKSLYWSKLLNKCFVEPFLGDFHLALHHWKGYRTSSRHLLEMVLWRNRF